MPRLRFPHHLELERDRSTIARVKLTKLLERDPRFADLPNFAEKLRTLSPVPSKIDTALSVSLNVKGSRRALRKDLISAALSGFTEKHFSDPAKRANYRALRQMQLQSQELATRGGQKKVSPVGGDKRRYDPTGKGYASTRYGTIARLIGSPLASSWLQVFRNPSAVIPCVQRKSRREVLFAKGKGGKGYRVRRRRTWASAIPC